MYFTIFCCAYTCRPMRNLLYTFIENHLANKSFNIKHFNLRKMFIANYSDFIQAFFEVDYSKTSGDVKQKREYLKKSNKVLKTKCLIHLLLWKKNLLKYTKKESNPLLSLMNFKLWKISTLMDNGICSRNCLIFFVALTKESKLCHVIIASSDGYFMNRIYNDSKLSKTSSFYEVD